MRTADRFRAAWKAFREVPDQSWVVAQDCGPFGYRTVHVARSEAAANAWAEKNQHGWDLIVKTRREWREIQIAVLETEAPWRAVGQLQSSINQMKTELGIAHVVELATVAKRQIGMPHDHL